MAKQYDRRKFSDDDIVTLLVSRNPKRPNSKAAKCFDRYVSEQTVAHNIARGITREDIRWDRAHNFIALSKQQTITSSDREYMKKNTIAVGSVLAQLAENGFADNIEFRHLQKGLPNLGQDDLEEACFSLQRDGLLHVEAVLGKAVFALILGATFYVRFDPEVHQTDPKLDLIYLCHLLSGKLKDTSIEVEILQEELSWSRRRTNPALSLLIEQLPRSAYRSSLPKYYAADYINATWEAQKIFADILDPLEELADEIGDWWNRNTMNFIEHSQVPDYNSDGTVDPNNGRPVLGWVEHYTGVSLDHLPLHDHFSNYEIFYGIRPDPDDAVSQDIIDIKKNFTNLIPQKTQTELSTAARGRLEILTQEFPLPVSNAGIGHNRPPESLSSDGLWQQSLDSAELSEFRSDMGNFMLSDGSEGVSIARRIEAKLGKVIDGWKNKIAEGAALELGKYCVQGFIGLAKATWSAFVYLLSP